jgi:ribosomal protein S18 acetylase RimI-like enzyme
MNSRIGELGADTVADTVKVAVMPGNHRAARFYQSLGFAANRKASVR